MSAAYGKHDIERLEAEIERLRARLNEVDAQLTAEDSIHARECIALRAEKDAEIERLRRDVMEISSRYLNPRTVGILTEPAPQPCADLTVQELLEWLRQPQYTNGRLDEHAAEHMVSAATLIERLLNRRALEPKP